MNLSNDLIKQFVKITKDDNTEKKETTVYGTAVKFNNKMYAKLDGSERLTPISLTSDVKEGERVTVLIKNHSAIVTGNISSPSARTDDLKETNKTVDKIDTKITEFETVVADKVSTKELDAQKARIDDLESDNVTINEKLTANEASISDLESDNITINEKLTANEASIENIQSTKIDATIADLKYATIENLNVTNETVHNLKGDYGSFKVLATNNFAANDASIKKLQTDKLNATDADLKYANIDFSNIEKAAIEQFYATSGIIKDLVIGDQTVTGELIGITIKGDLIEGNTIVAEKLVIKGNNGLYYKLNTDGIALEKDQTDYNSLNGSIIRAKTIAATKIDVKDLVAFNATIAGFNITETSIYSGAKTSSTNTTRGIYLGKDGQSSFGDGTNYIKYYKDQNGHFKLEVSADSLLLTSGKNISEAITDVENKIDNVKSINKTEVSYQIGTNGSIPPTGTWEPTIPTITAGQYLWTRTIITYTDSTKTTLYSVSKNGKDGTNGKDALTLNITSSSGTVFKNNSDLTTLTAHVYKGGVEQTISDSGVCGTLGSIKWYKGNSTSSVATSKSITILASDIVNTQLYTCQLEK